MQEQEQRQRELREKLARARPANGWDEQGPHGTPGVGGAGAASSFLSPIPEEIERRRPITRLFFSVYDNLGGLIAVNLFTFLLTLPLIMALLTINVAAAHGKPVGPLLPLLLLVLIAAPAWAAASSYCARIVEEQEHSLSEYWSDYRRFIGRGILLAVGQLVLGGALLYATGWYLGRHVLPLGIISLYAWVVWALCGIYLWPLLVRGYSWRAIARNAVVLVVAAPLRAATLLAALVGLSIISTITGIGIVLLLFSLWAMLPNQALVLTRERLEQRRHGSGA